jgi:hypothetical protein
LIDTADHLAEEHGTSAATVNFPGAGKNR